MIERWHLDVAIEAAALTGTLILLVRSAKHRSWCWVAAALVVAWRHGQLDMLAMLGGVVIAVGAVIVAERRHGTVGAEPSRSWAGWAAWSLIALWATVPDTEVPIAVAGAGLVAFVAAAVRPPIPAAGPWVVAAVVATWAGYGRRPEALVGAAMCAWLPLLGSWSGERTRSVRPIAAVVLTVAHLAVGVGASRWIAHRTLDAASLAAAGSGLVAITALWAWASGRSRSGPA